MSLQHQKWANFWVNAAGKFAGGYAGVFAVVGVADVAIVQEPAVLVSERVANVALGDAPDVLLMFVWTQAAAVEPKKNRHERDMAIN